MSTGNSLVVGATTMRWTVYFAATTLAAFCSARCQAQDSEKPLAVIVNDLRSTDIDVRSVALDNINDILLSTPLNSFAERDWEYLRSIRQQAEPLLPDLLELLDSSNDQVRKVSMRLIASMGTKARMAVPKLKQYVQQQLFLPI